MDYSTKKIAEIIAGILHGEGSNGVEELLIDSRKLSNAEVSLFFAIKGDRHDGHKYLPELFDKGVRSFVVSSMPSSIETFKGACFIVVENTLNALQALCAFHRTQFAIPVVGITGSNGKTIVKEWMYQLLRDDKNIVRSPKSFNSQVGVPLSVWQLNKEHELGLFEAGISMPHEMVKLAPIVNPSIGVFTNIGEAHSENFESQEQKVQEKLRLFDNCKHIIYCSDYELIDQAIGNASASINRFSWSRKSKADLQIGKISIEETETTIQGVYDNDFIDITIPFTDDASIENVIHCWALMLLLKYNNEQIKERMVRLSPIAMRLELKEGVNNCSVINDSYNSDLGSLAIALDFLNQQKQHPNKTLVLSDILQSGKNKEALYQEVANLVNEKGVTRIIGIGKDISSEQDKFTIKGAFFNSTEEFLKVYDNSYFKDETVLLKGARPFGFEAINKALQQKAHKTVLEINLNAIVHNLNYYRSKLKPETKIMAMVKAFSYGSGSFEIANILQFHHIDYLAVAYADEGVELRKAGITVPIMVMNPEEDGYDAMIEHNLEPEIFSLGSLSLFENSIKKHTIDKAHPIRIHIKVDTGMHRLGFDTSEINELIVRVKNNPSLQIASVFSHLAASDDIEHKDFTLSQINKLEAAHAIMQAQVQAPIMKHILNSAGIANYNEAQFDMVRLGIGLYGVGANEEEQQLLQNVSSLRTTISQIKTVPANETIGYSRVGKANSDMRIAILPIGYADGLNRKLSNGKGYVMVQGKLAPIVGNVCMDMCMVDITTIAAKEGEEVLIFGNEHSILSVANAIGTIPYEVLTNVSRRVKRVYYQE